MRDVIPGAVIVIAKTPQPGLVKTRLSPPLTADEACSVAWACLHDTLDAASAVPAQRHVLLLSGPSGAWVPPGFEVIPQRGAGLAERLAAGFTDVGDNAVLIAMDTPQVSSSDLSAGLLALHTGCDSVLGSAFDGGYWLVGLRSDTDPAPVFDGIPMSCAKTGMAQLRRLASLGLSTHLLRELRDVDTVDDLRAVVLAYPETRVAHLAASMARLDPYNSGNNTRWVPLESAI
jgi:uncharacterized protein